MMKLSLDSNSPSSCPSLPHSGFIGMHHPLILYFLDTVFSILQNAPSLIKVLCISHSLASVWPCSHDYSPLGIWRISRYWRHHYQSPTLKRCHRLLSISVIQHCDQKQLGTGWFIWFTSPDHSDGGKPGQEPKEPAGRDWGSGHGETLLTGFLLVACSVCFLYS